MNIYSDKEQKTNQVEKSNHLKRWLRRILCCVGFGIGLALFFFAGIFIYVSLYPVNITSFAKYWMPLPIISGVEKGKPAGRITFSKLVLEWPIYKKGLSAPITVSVDGMKLLDVHGKVQDYIDHGQISLASSPLFHKIIKPLSLEISGVHFQFKRGKDKQYSLNLSQINMVKKHHLKVHFDFLSLKHIKIAQGDFKLDDDITHNVIELKKIDVDIHPFFVDQALVAVGHIMIQFNTNGNSINIVGHSAQEDYLDMMRNEVRKTGRLIWDLNIDHFNPSDFSVLTPSWSKLSNINIPVSLNARVALQLTKDKKSFLPSDTDISFQIGKGKVVVNQQAYYPSSAMGLVNLHLPLGMSGPAQVDLKQFNLQLRSVDALDDNQSGPNFIFKAQLALSNLLKAKDVYLNLSVFSPLLDFSTIKAYWPTTVAKGAHAWVTQNIPEGQAQDFRIYAGLSSHTGWKHLDLVSLGGGIKSAKNMEIYWLRPVPPLKDITAQLTFVDVNHILITHQGGYQVVYPDNVPTKNIAKLAIPEGKIWISGLSNHHESAIISPKIKGKLQDLLALLSEPRLKILSRHPVPFTHPSGVVEAELNVDLPLKKKITMEQIKIHAHNKIQNAYLGNVALDRDLKKATLIIDVDNRHLEVTGKGIFSVFPVSLNYVQQFYHANDQSKTDIAKIKLQITPDNLKEMGVDTAGDLTGTTNLLVNYDKLYNGKASVKLNFDFLKSRVSLPIWEKNIGEAGNVSGTVMLDHNKLVKIDNVFAKGKNLLVKAEVEIKNNVPQQLNIQSFKIGRSIGSAILKFPMTKDAIDHPSKGDVNISVKASTLDISPFLKQYFTKTKQKHAELQKKENGYKLPIAATGKYTGPLGRHWTTNLQAKKIFYTKDKYLGSVTIYTEYNGVRLMNLSYGMRFPTVVTASLFPKNNYRLFYLDAQNLGILLESLGVFTQISGGHTVLKGNFDDSQLEAPFKGSLHVGSFIIKNPPSALLHLSNVSIYGLFKKRPKNGMKITELKSGMSIQNGILTVKNGRLYNSEVGATLEGDVNLDRAMFDLTGTIVPAYAINRLFGHIPAVGKLFSPEKGGGFIAIPFDIMGPFKKTVMDVHVSRILTPGFLRRLY